MMKQLFEETIWRSWSAFASSVEMLSKPAPTMMKLDAVISRAAHMLSRPVLYSQEHDGAQRRCTGNK